MESILEYVRRRLKEVGSDKWEEIAAAAGCAPSTPRKIVYERENPGVNTVEPLFRFFLSMDGYQPIAAPTPPDAPPPPTAEAGPQDRRQTDRRQFDVGPPVVMPDSAFGDLVEEHRSGEDRRNRE